MKYSTAFVLFSLHSIMTRFPPLRLSPVLLQGIMLNVGLSSQKPSRSQRTFLHSSTTKHLKEIHIDEEFRIAVNLSMDRFRHSDQKGLSLSTLSPYTHTHTHRVRSSLVSKMVRLLFVIKQSWNFLLAWQVLREHLYIDWPSRLGTSLKAKGKLHFNLPLHPSLRCFKEYCLVTIVP